MNSGAIAPAIAQMLGARLGAGRHVGEVVEWLVMVLKHNGFQVGIMIESHLPGAAVPGPVDTLVR